MTGLLLVGASGLAREVAAVELLLRTHGRLQVLDDDAAKWGTMLGVVPVQGGLDLVAKAGGDGIVVTVGRGTARSILVERLTAYGVTADRYASVLHPRIVLPGDCTIGAGSVALDGVVLTADVEVGSHVVLMPQVTLTHGCVVEDFATLCAAVTLGGDVLVRSGAYLGMNACVREGVTVGRNATLGMGSVLLEDLPDGETWVGVPARPLHTRIGAAS